MGKVQLYKYEFPKDVVEYLIASVDVRQIRGVDQAKSMLHVISLLRTPINMEEINKVEAGAKEEAKKEEAKNGKAKDIPEGK